LRKTDLAGEWLGIGLLESRGRSLQGTSLTAETKNAAKSAGAAD